VPDSTRQLYLNGIDGTTGNYLVPPLDTRKAAALIKGNPMDPDLARWLGRLWRVISQPNLGLPIDINATDVAKAGWGIVFHRDEDQAVKDALAPLIEHRRGRVEKDRVKVLEYRKDEGRAQWLARHDISAGTVEPWKLPFYLLLVGSPEKIPFVFGHQLSVEYAVGRICFDTPDEYTRYAANLIAYESGATVPNSREVVFFAPRHDFDNATQMSADLLVNPLVDGVPSQGTRPAEPGVAARWSFASRKIWGASATKAALTAVLTPAAGAKPPALLFTASHGMGFPKDHPDQLSKQGALLCQDWPGLGKIDPAHYFSAADLPAGGHVEGLVSFHFACYAAGTPSHDRFLHIKNSPPPALAERAFFAALPRALMIHPNGGALACIGHVERAWGYSITSSKGTPQLLPFRNAIGRILTGQPVGYAMKDFYERYAALSTSLNSTLEEISFGASVPEDELAMTWAERNDAEGYIVLGDPAVQIRVKDIA
jgi:hypothetical protein